MIAVADRPQAALRPVIVTVRERIIHPIPARPDDCILIRPDRARHDGGMTLVRYFDGPVDALLGHLASGVVCAEPGVSVDEVRAAIRALQDGVR